MIILGAGLTGCLAAHAFKNAVVHEYLETPNTHSALLRFRSDAVSELTGIPFKKVKVTKGIYYNGRFVQPDIRVSNLYSHKVTGGCYDRSISDISPAIRYVAPVDFHHRMLDNLGDRVVCNSKFNLKLLKPPIISTLPLPILATKLGMDCPISKAEKALPIYVSTVTIPKCDVYQTIYFPGNDTYAYRASITGDQLIVESIHPMGESSIDQMLIDVFGINPDFNLYQMNKEQPNGKFVPLEETYRKNLMYDITSQHQIYSLGRHATWRKVLLDDVAQDISQIERMIKHSAYDLMVGIK